MNYNLVLLISFIWWNVKPLWLSPWFYKISASFSRIFYAFCQCMTASFQGSQYELTAVFTSIFVIFKLWKLLASFDQLLKWHFTLHCDPAKEERRRFTNKTVFSWYIIFKKISEGSKPSKSKIFQISESNNVCLESLKEFTWFTFYVISCRLLPHIIYSNKRKSMLTISTKTEFSRSSIFQQIRWAY